MYFITLLEDIIEDNHLNQPAATRPSKHCVAYFETVEEAKFCVERNSMSAYGHENSGVKYVIIEYIPPRTFAIGKILHWFAYAESSEAWFEIPTPANAAQSMNYSIG